MWLSVFMTVGGFSWVASVLHQFGGLPWILCWIALLLFSLIAQPQFPIFALLIRYLFKHAPQSPWRFLAWALFASLFYAGLDWISPKLFQDTFGHSLFLAKNLRQVADLGGAHLLTFWILLVNLALHRFLFSILPERKNLSAAWKPALRQSAPILGTCVLLGIGAFFYGQERRLLLEKQLEAPLSTVRAAAIQGNVGDFDKVAAERGIRGAAEKVLTTFFALSDQALDQFSSPQEKPAFLVWPETTYPSTFRTPNTSDELMRDLKVESFVKSRGVPLLFGGYDRLSGKDYNALFLLSPLALSPSTDGNATSSNQLASTAFSEKRDLQIYRKNILLLFGEYIPGAEQIRFIREAFPQVGNFGRGPGPELLSIPLPPGHPLPALRVNPVICYEALFPNYSIDAARKGSQLILNITNDSWFGPVGEPYLHLSLVAFRSIETRLPQLRSTNTGVSALILPTGEITKPTSLFQPEILQADIPIIAPLPTLMKAWGDWFGPTALILGLSGFLVLAVRARRALPPV